MSSSKGSFLFRGKNILFYEKTNLLLRRGTHVKSLFSLSYAHAVRRGVWSYLDRIFDSEKKAIDYIENELKDYDCHRDDYGIYEAEINDYESISLSIEEMEVG